MKNVVILLGPPGSGKGTQADLLSKKLGFLNLSTGSLLRKEVESRTEFSKEISSFIDKGNLISDDLMFKILSKKINDNISNGFILDGFPRTLPQAKMLAEYIEKSKKLILKKVFVIEIDKEHVLERIGNRITCKKCGTIYNNSTKKTKIKGICDNCQSSDLFDRGDDLNMEAINKRIDIFKANISDIVSFYEKKSLIFLLNGLKSVSDINYEMMKALDSN